MLTTNRMYVKREFAILTHIKVMSVMLVVCMLAFSLTACGTVSQEDVRPTTENSTEEVGNNDQQAPEDTIVDGYWSDDPTVEYTEESSTTLEQSGTYTYDVGGVSITLSTCIDDYISTNHVGALTIDLNRMATDLGYHFEGVLHPDEPQYWVGFHLNSDPGVEILYDDFENAQYPRSIDIIGVNGLYSVHFNTTHVDDESIDTYLITNGGSTGLFIVDLDQIVIFTYLLENASVTPTENCMANRGFSENNSGYYVINN